MNNQPVNTGSDQPKDQSGFQFPVEEYRNRLKRLSSKLHDIHVDVYIATTPENIHYFSGFDPLGLYFYQQLIFVPDDAEPFLITHKCEKELAYRQTWFQNVKIWEHGDDPVAVTVAKLREVGMTRGKRVGLEMDNWYLKASVYTKLCSAFPDVSFIDVTGTIAGLRTIKSDNEVALMREAARYSDIGFEAAIGAIKPGVRENEVLGAIQSTMSKAGSEYPTLPFIVGSGPRSGLFHAVPTSRVIQEDEPVMLEITGVAARYNSNIVRTVVAGKASPLLRTLWEVVTEAFWRSFEQVRPGARIGEIDRVSRIIRARYRKYIPARAGFGMGLAYPPVWAGTPNILESSNEVLQPGMIFSLEPSIAQYKGVSVIFGYNIWVTETGAEILQSTPRGIFEIAE